MPVLTYVTGTNNPADLTVYTFSGVSLGSASPKRKIVVAVIGRDTGTTATLTGVTVGGFAATSVINQRTAAIDTTIAALYSIDAGTDSDLDGVTSANIVVTFSEAMLRSSIDVFHLDGATALFDTGFTSTTAAGATQTVSIDVPANGAVIALGAINSGGVPGAVWTGLTERSDQHVEGNFIASTASDVFASAQTLIVTMTTFNPGIIERIIIAASWPPSIEATIAADGGSYTLTGTVANPTLSGASGDYFGNRYFGARYFGNKYWGLGEPVGFLVAAEPSSYLLTGHDQAIQTTHALALSPLLPGDYTLTGTAATLTKTTAYSIGAAAGSYTLTGTAANTTHSGVGGDYFGNRYFGARYFGDRYWGVSGPAVVVGFSVVAEPGSYLLTGHDQALQRTGHLALSPLLPGEYTLTGTDATAFITAVPITPTPPSLQRGGGKPRRQWIKGAPYPWLQVPQDEDDELEKVKVTLPLVEEALEEIQLYDGVPAWWALQNARRVKREIPEYVYVPEREDHVAVLHAIMQKIADDAIAKRLAEERDDEEALMLLLS